MSDLIDRQALLKQIDIDSDGEPGYYGDTWKFIDTIKNMPNVYDLPKDTDTISRQAAISAICSACGKIDCDKMDKCEKLQLPPANCSEFPNNSDTISRKWLMECVDEGWIKFDTEKDKNIYVHLVRDIAPSAQPERIRGRWTRDNACSECGCQPWFSGDIHNYNFCPNCGAQMEVTT